jgi:hypothetical protein
MGNVFRINKAEWAVSGKGSVLLAFQRKSIRSRAAAFVLSETEAIISFDQGITLVLNIPSPVVDDVRAVENILIVLFEDDQIVDEFEVRVTGARN